MGKFFGEEKPAMKPEIDTNFDHFCDVMDPQNYPKWSENHLKHQKTQQNDCIGLKMRMGKCFGMENRW